MFDNDFMNEELSAQERVKALCDTLQYVNIEMVQENFDKVLDDFKEIGQELQFYQFVNAGNITLLSNEEYENCLKEAEVDDIPGRKSFIEI